MAAAACEENLYKVLNDFVDLYQNNGLFALGFSEVILDESEGLINYHLIQYLSSKSYW